ncbi:MAG TPA: zinc-binding dehydrogenase [Acidimicrobiales bacterium]|nr:zinc-binding dehydrogenase [Acidimicrobiales bacterium]
MRSVVIRDGDLVLEERADPIPGAGQVLVAVKAAGLNAADLLQRRGFYPAPPDAPADVPGLELSGEVVALGEGATRFTVGDRVMAVVGGGGQSTRAVVHERLLMPVPNGVIHIAAGGFPEAFTTAHDALFTQCGLAMGERVCIHGAAGGVGTAAVQLAVSAGCEVTATVRDPARHADVTALGAARVVDPAGFADHGPFDVVLELVGAPNMAANMTSLASGGRIAVIGVGAGATAEINLLELMRSRARIHGSTLRARALEDKADAARRVERHVLPLLATGRVQVPISSTFPLDDVAAAYDAFAAGGKFGKIILTA